MLSAWIAYALVSLVLGYTNARHEYKRGESLGTAVAAWFTVAVLWPFILLLVGGLSFANYARDHGWNRAVGRVLFGKR